MDDRTFDARVRALGRSANRRAVLGGLAALAGLGAAQASAKHGKVRGSRGADKVTICHYDEDAELFHRISIARAAWPAHRKHGDYELVGDCCNSEECTGPGETCDEGTCRSNCVEPASNSSYGITCYDESRECTEEGTILTATCYMGDGFTPKTTSINVDSCQAEAYEITNCNGTLTCGNCP